MIRAGIVDKIISPVKVLEDVKIASILSPIIARCSRLCFYLN